MTINTVLLVSILALVAWMKPWSDSDIANKRTITVSGQGTVAAEADEFTFRPAYEFEGESSEEVVQAGTDKANSVRDGLKEIGVEDSDIKLDASSYESWYRDELTESYRSYFTFTVTAHSKEKAQEIQDYLLTTNPTGSITPTPSFSTEKQKELANQARSKAVEDARSSAQVSAQELGLEVDEVVSIKELQSTGGDVYPMPMEIAVDSTSSYLPVATGEQDFSINVEVVFEVK